MKSKFRIRETSGGYVVEERVPYVKWFKLRWRWECCATYYGTNTPYCFSTYERAEDILETEVKFEAARNSCVTGEEY